MLIIINGPCGAGKTTVAKAIHEQMPLSLLLELDTLRRQISQYPSHHEKGFSLMIRAAKSLISSFLSQNYDVIVDKAIYDTAVVDDLVNLGQTYRTPVREIILWVDKENSMKRTAGRSSEPGWEFFAANCPAIWHQFEALKAQRSQALVIDTNSLKIHEVIEKIFDVVKE